MDTTDAKPCLYDGVPPLANPTVDEKMDDHRDIAFFHESNKGPKYKYCALLDDWAVEKAPDTPSPPPTDDPEDEHKPKKRKKGTGEVEVHHVREFKEEEDLSKRKIGNHDDLLIVFSDNRQRVEDEALQKGEEALLKQIQIQLGYSDDLTEGVVTQQSGRVFGEDLNVNLQETVTILEASLASLQDENKRLEKRVYELGEEADSLGESKFVELYEEKLESKDDTIKEYRREIRMMEEAFGLQEQTEIDLDKQHKSQEELIQKYDSLQKLVDEMRKRKEEMDAMKAENEKMNACLELGTPYYAAHLQELRMLSTQPQSDPKVVALTQLVQSTCKLYSQAEESHPQGEISALRTQISALTSQMTGLVVDTQAIKDQLATDAKERQKQALREQCTHIEKLTMALQANQPNRFADYSKNAVALALIVILLL